LILEYERSGSPEYWGRIGISAQCSLVKSFYGEQATQLWVYGDEFIDGLLALSAFKTLKEIRFHGLSSFALALFGSPKFAARCVLGDKYIANIWPVRKMSSNRMLAVEKPAHQ
jgi:hypothetical protein